MTLYLIVHSHHLIYFLCVLYKITLKHEATLVNSLIKYEWRYLILETEKLSNTA